MRPNRSMSSVEHFLERLLERPSARFFGTRIQPVQLYGKIERAMEHGRVAGPGGVRVPDRFTVRVRPQDLARLDGPTELAVNLASQALDWARRRGYALAARPRVAIIADPRLRPGDIDVEAQFSDQSGVNTSMEDPTRTAVFQAPVIRSPQATIEVREPSGRRRMVVAGGGPLTIGRADDNLLILDDDRASRRHARLQGRGGLLVLTDLDSTNGIRVNGSLTHEVAVGDGDVIEIGGSVLTILSINEA